MNEDKKVTTAYQTADWVDGKLYSLKQMFMKIEIRNALIIDLTKDFDLEKDIVKKSKMFLDFILNFMETKISIPDENAQVFIKELATL